MLQPTSTCTTTVATTRGHHTESLTAKSATSKQRASGVQHTSPANNPLKQMKANQLKVHVQKERYLYFKVYEQQQLKIYYTDESLIVAPQRLLFEEKEIIDGLKANKRTSPQFYCDNTLTLIDWKR